MGLSITISCLWPKWRSSAPAPARGECSFRSRHTCPDETYFSTVGDGDEGAAWFTTRHPKDWVVNGLGQQESLATMERHGSCWPSSEFLIPDSNQWAGPVKA